MEDRKQISVRHSALLGTIALLIVLAVLGWTNLPKAGQVYVIQGERGAGTVYVPVTIATAKDLKKFTDTGDHVGLAQLVLEGKVFVVPSGARVRVLDHSWVKSLYQIQVLDGASAGKDGWISSKELSKRVPASP